MPSSQEYVPHIVFAGGVTGGHLFPGLAIAEQLAATRPGVRITFLGAGTAFDRTYVARAGHRYVHIDCPRSPRQVLETAKFGYRMLRGFRAATDFLRSQRASLVVGLGGFASLPTGLAAARLKLPLVLLEQNMIVGRANRRLAAWAHALCLSFEDTRWSPAHAGIPARYPTVVTGTPVRRRFLQVANDHRKVAKRQQLSGDNMPSERTFDSEKPILLVLGGSGGARLLNQTMPAVVTALRDKLQHWQIVHQTGPGQVAMTRAAYASARIAATVEPFFDDVPTLLARARFVVCRPGGSTLAELSALGVPAILIPFAAATDDHQRHNALAFAAAGGAVVVDSDNREPAALTEQLARAIRELIANPGRCLAMAEALECLSHPHAARHISEIVRQFSGKLARINDQQSPAPPAPPPYIDSRAA
ncbi:MAG TPA: UDP-N-acetylglucosamine--N-acetylmuramyl-(pentapeptide) pyrophosphoryl-undecaprenol N-acetylglucosamine transferase [Pirellulales bacterium]